MNNVSAPKLQKDLDLPPLISCAVEISSTSISDTQVKFKSQSKLIFPKDAFCGFMKLFSD